MIGRLWRRLRRRKTNTTPLSGLYMEKAHRNDYRLGDWVIVGITPPSGDGVVVYPTHDGTNFVYSGTFNIPEGCSVSTFTDWTGKPSGYYEGC